MTKEVKPIDITHTPDLLRLAEEVARSGIARVLRRGNEDVAEIRPVSPERKRAKRLSRASSRDAVQVVERTAGIFRTNQPPLSAEELRRKAEEAWAEDVLERIGD